MKLKTNLFINAASRDNFPHSFLFLEFAFTFSSFQNWAFGPDAKKNLIKSVKEEQKHLIEIDLTNKAPKEANSALNLEIVRKIHK